MKTAILYRMVSKDHICPFGTRAKALLESQGYQVEDHLLETREATDAFKKEHGVHTTPQTFIDGERVGGYDDLRIRFGKKPSPKKGEKSYKPIVALFGVSFLMAAATVWSVRREFMVLDVLHFFGAYSMCGLAIQKLRDPFSFTNSFLNYDLLAVRFIPYAYFYMFAELAAGLGMLSGVLPTITAGIAIVIGLEGATSVFKAVYIDRRELKCACMGGDSNVPLGMISLTENLLMIGMGLWILSAQ